MVFYKLSLLHIACKMSFYGVNFFGCCKVVDFMVDLDNTSVDFVHFELERYDVRFEKMHLFFFANTHDFFPSGTVRPRGESPY